MASSQELFDLVKSLAPNEKRHFQIFVSTNSAEKKYVKLFELLDEMESYDRDLIFKAFEGEKLLQSLHVTENYLFQKIMDSLRVFHEDNIVETKIYNMYSDALVLERRGFYTLALETLEKVEKMALKYHKYAILADIAPKKVTIILATENKNLLEQTEEAYKHGLEYAEILRKELLYRYYFQYFIVIARKFSHIKTPTVLDETNKKFAEFEKYEKPTDVSFHTQYLYHATKYIYYQGIKQREKAAENQAKAVSVWEAHPEMIQAYLSLYMVHLHNYIVMAIFSNKLEDAYLSIEKMKVLKTSTFDEQGEQFQNVYYLSQLYYLNTNAFDKAAALSKEIEEGMEKYKSKINPSRRLNFFYNTTVAYFLLEDYQKASDWLQKILSAMRNDEQNKNAQNFARIIQLPIYYKLSNKTVLEHLFRSVYRNKKLLEEMSDFEKTVLKHFKSLLKVQQGSAAELKIFEKMKKDLHNLLSLTVEIAILGLYRRAAFNYIKC